MNTEKLDNFKEAFSSRTGHCRLRCACGKEYFDNVNPGYSWEEGELESLQAGAGIAVFGAIGGVEFEGSYYAENCTCWHPRMERIIGFVDGHATQIAEYLSLEKAHKQRIADASPVVG